MLHADGRSEIRGLALRQNVVKHLAGDAQSFRRGRHGQADRRQDVFPDNLARMDGPKSVPLHVSHISAPRRQLRTNLKRGVTLTIHLVQNTGQLEVKEPHPDR